MSKSALKVRAPLFERLIDDEPSAKSEGHVKNTITLKQLRESIRSEISMLLNTRESKIPYSLNDDYEYLGKTRISNSYGLPDFSYFEYDKERAILRLAATLTNIIGKYEPRLANVKVQALEYDNNKQCLYLEVKGSIAIHEYVEQYTFPILIQDVQTRS